jgi:hypothetical protein
MNSKIILPDPPANCVTCRFHDKKFNLYYDNEKVMETIRDEYLFMFPEGSPAPEEQVDFSIELHTSPDIKADNIKLPENVRMVFTHVDMSKYLDEDGLIWNTYADSSIGVVDYETSRGVCLIADNKLSDQYLVANFAFFSLFSDQIRKLGFYNVHSSCVTDGKRGILITGFGGHGKTTSSLALTLSGMKMLGEDMIFLRRTEKGIEAFGCPIKPSATPNTLDMFPELKKSVKEFMASKGIKYAIDLDVVVPDPWAERVVVTDICFPNISADEQSRLEPISKNETVRSILFHSLVISTDKESTDNFAVICDMVRACNCYNLISGKDIPAAFE